MYLGLGLAQSTLEFCHFVLSCFCFFSFPYLFGYSTNIGKFALSGNAFIYFLLYLLRTTELAVDNVIKVPCTVISSDKRIKLVCTARSQKIAPIIVITSILLYHNIDIISPIPEFLVVQCAF